MKTTSQMRQSQLIKTCFEMPFNASFRLLLALF